MSRLAILASILALAAGSANCADDPTQANSIGGIAPSAMASSSDATLSTLAKGGKPALSVGDNTVKMVPIDSTDGVAHYGQHVTFDVFTSATNYPWVSADCYQNGTQVYHEANAMFYGTLGSTFTLGPTGLWQGGGAECVATLQNRDDYSRNSKIVDLASTSFTVEP